MRSVSLAAVFLFTACTTPEPSPTAPTPTTAPTLTPAPSPAATTLTGATPGAPITVRGLVSKTPWQHLMGGVAGKSDAYFDLAGGKEQTVVYWKDPPACAGDVIVSGKVIEVKGASKRPSGGETKADESFREKHVDVESAHCAD